ncbi:UNVERIFIED_CONTAM: Transposon Tf2-11 polyprotein [Sesamum radiatum]|uniref:Transposon Tf2-11 polyprotein n=1 Tax=Sesamum radiatum TaxID=300843 RepID=A0AAW2MYB6_SESRA
MTDLLKKMEIWNWTPQCQVAFDNLKRAMVTDPVLALPDMSKPFTVEIDASDFALGGVLMQDGHPVAFESWKLKDVERRYSMHEKELLAVVHCLRLWWHYLLGSPLVVKMDNIAVSHFMSQLKLTSRQARWQELLSEFYFVLEYRAGSSNHVADALSRRADLATLGSVAALSSSAVATSIRDRACDLLSGDPVAQGLVHLIEQGKARQFWLEEGLLMTKGNRLYVPKSGDLRKSLIAECHDTLWAGHPGEERTYALVQRAYYWPQMRDDVETYVRTCLICQQDKADHQKKAGLLQPLPIPKRPWESVSMDYISRLPKVGDLGTIIVMVDRLSKYATFIAAPKHVTAEGTTHLFFKHVVKYWGLLKDIQPLIPHTLDSPQGVRSPLARSFSQEWKQNVEIARSCLEKAQKWMKKYADNNRRFIEFNAGDLVTVKVPDPRLLKSSRGRDSRLMLKYVGPLPIIKRIGTVAYKIELPSWWKIHSVFHLFNEIHISNPCAIYCFATAPCLNLLLLLHTVLLFLSAHCASVGGYSVVVLLLGGSSCLLWTASHTMPLPPHCGKRLVRPGDAVPGHVLENRELVDSVLAAAAEQPRRAL